MVSRQSSCAKFLSGSQSNLILLNKSQNCSTLLSSYLGLKVVHSYQVFIVSESARYVYISGPIVLDNLQRSVPSS